MGRECMEGGSENGGLVTDGDETREAGVGVSTSNESEPEPLALVIGPLVPPDNAATVRGGAGGGGRGAGSFPPIGLLASIFSNPLS